MEGGADQEAGQATKATSCQPHHPLAWEEPSLVYLGTGGAEEAVIAPSVNVCRRVGSERGCTGVSPQQALNVGGASQALTLAKVKSLVSEVPGQRAEKQGEAG